jgi:hypothetical protein
MDFLDGTIYLTSLNIRLEVKGKRIKVWGSGFKVQRSEFEKPNTEPENFKTPRLNLGKGEFQVLSLYPSI